MSLAHLGLDLLFGQEPDRDQYQSERHPILPHRPLGNGEFGEDERTDGAREQRSQPVGEGGERSGASLEHEQENGGEGCQTERHTGEDRHPVGRVRRVLDVHHRTPRRQTEEHNGTERDERRGGEPLLGRKEAELVDARLLPRHDEDAEEVGRHVATECSHSRRVREQTRFVVGLPAGGNDRCDRETNCEVFFPRHLLGRDALVDEDPVYGAADQDDTAPHDDHGDHHGDTAEHVHHRRSNNDDSRADARRNQVPVGARVACLALEPLRPLQQSDDEETDTAATDGGVPQVGSGRDFVEPEQAARQDLGREPGEDVGQEVPDREQEQECGATIGKQFLRHVKTLTSLEMLLWSDPKENSLGHNTVSIEKERGEHSIKNTI